MMHAMGGSGGVTDTEGKGLAKTECTICIMCLAFPAETRSLASQQAERLASCLGPVCLLSAFCIQVAASLEHRSAGVPMGLKVAAIHSQRCRHRRFTTGIVAGERQRSEEIRGYTVSAGIFMQSAKAGCLAARAVWMHPVPLHYLHRQHTCLALHQQPASGYCLCPRSLCAHCTNSDWSPPVRPHWLGAVSFLARQASMRQSS